MSEYLCPTCGIQIPNERVEAGYYTCVNHSTASKKVGFMVFSHKTAPEIAIVDSSNEESVRIAKRAYERRR